MLILLFLVGAFILPAILVAWALNRDYDDPRDEASTDSPTATRARIALAAIIAVVAVASVAFQWISGHGIQQSAALFVGIPALLAIAAVFSPTPRSAPGVACKAAPSAFWCCSSYQPSSSKDRAAVGQTRWRVQCGNSA
jgi:hypothetical protein